MKKIISIIITLFIVMAFTSATIIVVDDFNEPNGAITTSSQNNMGYYYTNNACAYQNGQLYCHEDEQGASFDITPFSKIEFDMKCSASLCNIYIRDTPSYLTDYVQITQDDTTILLSGSTTIKTGVTNNVFHHYEIILDFTNNITNITLDNEFLGSWSLGNPVFNEVAYYLIADAPAGGFSTYLDNLTIDDGCNPDWSCTGYGSCNASDLAPCDSVVDNNVCGDNYSGDYSEFSAQPCNYCSYSITQLNQTGCFGAQQTTCYQDTNFATCCNITLLPSDCAFDNESVGCNTTPCDAYQGQYNTNDIVDVSIDGIVAFGIGIVSLMGIIGLVFLFKWGRKQVKVR